MGFSDKRNLFTLIVAEKRICARIEFSDFGIELFDKHFSLVTPADFYDIKSKDIIFEGFLGEFLHKGRGMGKKYITEEGALYEG